MQHNHANTAPAFPPPLSDPTGAPPVPSLPFNLDPFTAKQMAALQATSLAKAANRSAPGGTSASYFGGMSMNPHAPLSRPDAPHDGASQSSFHPLPHPDSQAPIPPLPPMNAQQNPAVQQQLVQQQRKRNWLNGLATLMVQRGTPLPPQLTGVPFPPNYDPASMPWKSLEVSPNDIGVVRLAGKDVDLFRLWGLILQAGGGQKVSQKGAWPLVVQQFDLPEGIPSATNPGEMQPTAAVMERYYTALLGPFEEAYRKNMMEQSQRAALAGRMPGAQQGQMNPQARQGGMVGMPGQNGMPNGGAPGMNMMPHANVGQNMDGPLPGQFHPAQAAPLPFQQPNSMALGGGMPANGASIPAMNGNGMPMGKGLPGGFPSMPGVAQNGTVDLEHDVESRKRKMQEAVESEAKRARQKTGGSDVSESRSSVAPPPVEAAVPPTITRTIRQPSRRKIEYVPYAREVDTAGGRDLDFVQSEWHRMGLKPVRRIEEWGHVDVEALTLSLRSRVSTEMSYALTTFTLLTLLQSSNQGRGFPITQALETLDEMVDLIEDLAFDEVEDEGYPDEEIPIVTHRELVNLLVEEGSKPFAGLAREQGSRDPDNGPRHRPAEIILIVINILRNLSIAQDSQEALAKHEKLLPVLLRLCSLAHPAKHTAPRPLATILSLSDLISIRKEVVNILLNIAFHIHLQPASPSKELLLTVRRAYELLASYLVDVTEAVSPFHWILQTGIPPAVHQPKPPALADLALETFSRFTLPDDNRQVVSRAVPQAWQWALLEALVHRLPVADNDFQVIMRDVWLTYVERLIMCLYSLAFLAPPAVKERAKRDRPLGFAKVMLRLVKKFTVHAPPELRHHFAISVRRAVEAMKVVDDAADAFDVGAAAAPTLAFGMGYGEQGDARVERGMGLLSGYQEDIALGLMMIPDLVDPLLFSELESLVRVGR